MSRSELIVSLIQVMQLLRDANAALTLAAQRVVTGLLRPLYLNAAADCRDAADDLRLLVEEYGGDVNSATVSMSGTASNTAQHGWARLQDIDIAPGGIVDELRIALVCEQGLGQVIEHYRGLLARGLPSSVNATLQRHYEVARRAFDDLRRERDATKRAKGRDDRPSS